MTEYAVQILRVHEVLVVAHDELQAERAATRYFGEDTMRQCIAIGVQSGDTANGGAFESEDNAENWDYAKKHFHSLNTEWALS